MTAARKRHAAGVVLALGYAVGLAALTWGFASWNRGPGWGALTWSLLAFAPAAAAGALLARRWPRAGLPLLFVGGLPAQVAAFYLMLVNPRILFLPTTPETGVRLTLTVAAAILAWFAGFFLLLVPARRTPATGEPVEFTQVDAQADAEGLSPAVADGPER